MDLRIFLEMLKHQGLKGIALDIDETISDTGVDFFGRLLEKHPISGNPTPEELIQKYKFTDAVPEWQNEKAKVFMEEYRTSNEIQRDIPVMPGAVESVQAIHSDLVQVVTYITARPTIVTRGTEQWLNDNQFPSALVITRPEGIPHSQANFWKASVLYYLRNQVLGIFDDNHGLQTELPWNYNGTIFLFGVQPTELNSIEAIRKPQQERKKDQFNVIRVPDWNRAYDTVEKHNPLQQLL